MNYPGELRETFMLKLQQQMLAEMDNRGRVIEAREASGTVCADALSTCAATLAAHLTLTLGLPQDRSVELSNALEAEFSTAIDRCSATFREQGEESP